MTSKFNYLFRLSKWYIYACVVKIYKLVQKKSYIQDYNLENEVKVTNI